MRCYKHPPTEAVAVCAYCGRGLCRECLVDLNAPRAVCSDSCATALSRAEHALEAVLRQTVQSARASAFYCYLCGGLSALAAVVAWFMLPSPFLILFTSGCAVALIFSGFWYGRAAGKHRI